MRRLLLLLALVGCGSEPQGLEGTVWLTPGLLTQRVDFDANGRYTVRTFHPDMKTEMGAWFADSSEVEFTPDGAAAKHNHWTRSHDGKWLWLWWWSNGSTVYFLAP
jgi:hypothetical protein